MGRKIIKYMVSLKVCMNSIASQATTYFHCLLIITSPNLWLKFEKIPWHKLKVFMLFIPYYCLSEQYQVTWLIILNVYWILCKLYNIYINVSQYLSNITVKSQNFKASGLYMFSCALGQGKVKLCLKILEEVLLLLLFNWCCLWTELQQKRIQFFWGNAFSG